MLTYVPLCPLWWEILSWMDVEFCQMLYLSLLRWSCGFVFPFMNVVFHFDLHTLNHPCNHVMNIFWLKSESTTSLTGHLNIPMAFCLYEPLGLSLPQNTLLGATQICVSGTAVCKSPNKLFLFAASCIIFWLIPFSFSFSLSFYLVFRFHP